MEGDPNSVQDFLGIMTFIFERWEFIIGLIFGSAGTYTSIKISKKSKTNFSQKGAENASAQVVDSPNADLQVAHGDALRQEGRNGVLANVTNSPGAILNIAQPTIGNRDDALGPSNLEVPVIVAALDANQAHILKKIQETLSRLNIQSSFSDRYQSAINHLNNSNTQVCISEYHSAFLEIVPVLSDRDTYNTIAPPPENLLAFENSFAQIKAFMNSASHDHVALRTHVEAFESGLLILLGYL